MLTQEKSIALNIAKEIAVAKLSEQCTPTHTDKDTGKMIASMFSEIYNTVYKIINSEE